MTRARLRNAVVGGLCGAALLAAALTSCGDDGVEAPTPVSPVSLDQLIEACIVTNGCGVKVWPKVSNCLDAYYDLAKPLGTAPVYDKIYQCVLAAEGDCTKVFACYGSNRYAGSCDTTNYTATCDGDQGYSCDAIAHKVFIFDCAAAVLSCQTKKSSSVDAYCSRGSCTPGSYKTKCEGDLKLSCVDGVIQLDDCAAVGLYCGTHDLTGTLGCLGNQKKKYCGLDPKKQFTPSCNAYTAVTCVNNQVSNEDCSKRLYKKACRNGACDFAGSECTGDDLNKCQGDKLQYCKEGKWVTLDCASLNLGKCQSAVFGANCSAKNW